MPTFGTFDLGETLRNAEAIQSLRRSSTLDQLRESALREDIETSRLNRSIAEREVETSAQAAAGEQLSNLGRVSKQLLTLNPQSRRAAAGRLLASPQFGEAFKALGFDPASMDLSSVDDASLQAELEQLAALGNVAGLSNVQSTQTSMDGNLLLVMRDGSIHDTGQKVRPQNLQFQEFQLPDGRVVQGQVDQTTGAAYDLQGNMIAPPIRGSVQAAAPGSAPAPGGGQGRPLVASTQPMAAPAAPVAPQAPSNLGQGRTPEAEAAATTEATEAVKARVEREAEAVSEAKDSDRTYSTFAVARDALMDALGKTATGPIDGRVPAVTAAQQTADGARAAMAPVLKQLFRVAGEGIFTDKDQELLLAMLPDRKDYEESRINKMRTIDAIIREKLGLSGSPSGAPASQGGWTVEEVK